MNEDLRVGQCVRLDPCTRWWVGADNPTNCNGTVDNVDEYWLGVKWDNGYHNSYRRYDSDLIPVEATADSALETLV